MTTQYQVETGCVEVSNMLLKVADENGWFGHPAPGEHRPWLLAFPEARRCGWNSCDFSSYETISVTAFIELLRQGPKPKEPPPIMIGRFIVQFEKDLRGVSVGCEFVPTNIVDEIHKRLHAT